MPLTDRGRHVLIYAITIIGIVSLLAITWLSAGCLSTHLRTPVYEHSIQLETLCDVAQTEASETLAKGVCQAAENACLIDAAVRKEDGSQCR